MMTYELALEHPEIFAAAVPVAGSVHPGWYETKTKKNPISILDIHGAKDNVIPSNMTLSTETGWKYETTAQNMAHWTEHNQCKGEGKVAENAYKGQLDTWCRTVADECADGTMVGWCAWRGDHVWPNFRRDRHRNFFFEHMIWDFLKAHPKP